MKEVRVVLSSEAEEVYKKLNSESENNKQSRMILKAVNNKIEFIKANIHYGSSVAKNLIPKEYKEKYGLTNLFVVDLPTFWRMIYTLTNEGEIEIVAFVLDIFDHDNYNKKFGYRKK